MLNFKQSTGDDLSRVFPQWQIHAWKLGAWTFATIYYSTLLERRLAPHPVQFENLGPREADSWLFPVREWEQRRLTRDWCRIYGANENAAGAGGPVFREAVSAHRSLILSRRLPPSPFSPAAPCTARRKNQALIRDRNFAAPEGRRCKVSGAHCVGARNPPSHRSRVSHLQPCRP